MPGMGNIQSMLSKMGMGGLGGAMGGGKMNMGAMEANLNKRMSVAKTKERMKAKAEANAKARVDQQNLQQSQVSQQPAISEEELLSLFSSAEKAERTPRGSKPVVNDGKKKKKGKK